MNIRLFFHIGKTILNKQSSVCCSAVRMHFVMAVMAVECGVKNGGLAVEICDFDVSFWSGVLMVLVPALHLVHAV